MGDGGFHALESWLYDHDYVDLARRRVAFLSHEPKPVPHAPAAPRIAQHTPAGVPTLVRELGRRRIHVTCEYHHTRLDGAVGESR